MLDTNSTVYISGRAQQEELKNIVQDLGKLAARRAVLVRRNPNLNVSIFDRRITQLEADRDGILSDPDYLAVLAHDAEVANVSNG